LWNPVSSKYKLAIQSQLKLGPKEILIYEDLNFDGNSEKIRFIKDFIGRPALLVEEKGQILYQWNLKGEFVPRDFYHFADYNGNGRKEIFVFTHQNDSIFLDAMDSNTEEKIIQHRFISTYDKTKGRIDFSVYKPLCLDVDNNGKKELVFSLACAFSHTTRKLCLYHIDRDILHISAKAGCSVFRDVIPFDLDEDGQYEFIGNIHSPGNSKFEYPYSDQYSWLMVCNKDMSYTFPPKKIGVYPALLQVKPFKEQKRNCLAAYYHHSGTEDSSFLALFDSSGNTIRKLTLRDKNPSFSDLTTFERNGQYKIALYRNHGIIEIYNDKLVLENSIESMPYLGRIMKLDMDGDGTEEILFSGINRDQLIITRHDFSYPAIVQLNEDFSVSYGSLNREKGQSTGLVFQNGAYQYVLSYNKDKLYTYRYLIWLGIFLLSFTLFYFLGKAYQYYIRKQYEDEKRITSLQVKAIEQQMSPHFTLNILNSIGNLYENHDKQKAQYYFGKYSKLLRITLISSGEIAVPLEDELQFTQNYLELERLRLNDAFNFQFVDNQNIPDVKVPKFLIHTFAENAVKHGLFPIHGIREGNINIDLIEDKDHIKIIIEDDGVGRIKTKKYNTLSTG